MLLLCYPRLLGYTFNPLSVYFCHRSDGALALRIPANAEPAKAAVIELNGTGTNEVTWGHLIIEVGANAAQNALSQKGPN